MASILKENSSNVGALPAAKMQAVAHKTDSEHVSDFGAKSIFSLFPPSSTLNGDLG